MLNKKIIPLLCAVVFAGQSVNASSLTTVERFSSAGSGIAKVVVGTAIVGSIVYSGYMAYTAASAACSLAFSPIGTTSCISYVIEINGTAAASPLIYSLAAGSPFAAQEALFAASVTAVISNKLSIGVVATGVSALYAKFSDSVSSAVSSAAWFTSGCFSDGFSDLSKAYSG